MKDELIVVPGQVFNVIGVDEAFVAKINEECLKMKINGISDKDGYERVKQAKMIYVHTRVKVEKHGKALRDKVNVYTKAVIAEEKRLIALLTPGEEHLAAEQKAIDDELKAIKEAEARKEAERIQGRIDRLSAFGMGLFGVEYRLPYAGPLIPQSMVSIMSDEDFETFCASVQGAVTSEKERLEVEEKRIAHEAAEKERLAKEEADRLAKEKAEQEAERLRLETLQKELDDKAAALKAEQEKIEREKQKEIEDAKHAEEVKKAEEAAAEKSRIETEARIKREAEEKAEAERLAKIAAEKKAARAPDKEKILAWIKLFNTTNIPTPQLKSAEAKEIIDEALNDLETLLQEVQKNAEEL